MSTKGMVFYKFDIRQHNFLDSKRSIAKYLKYPTGRELYIQSFFML